MSQPQASVSIHYDVPRSEWQPFCDRFTHTHRGEWVTVAATDRDSESQLARARLTRLAYAGEGAPPELRVVVDESDGRRGAVALAGPTRLVLEQIGGDLGTRLVALSESGRAVELQFERPLIPGLLDGLP